MGEPSLHFCRQCLWFWDDQYFLFDQDDSNPQYLEENCPALDEANIDEAKEFLFHSNKQANAANNTPAPNQAPKTNSPTQDDYREKALLLRSC